MRFLYEPYVLRRFAEGRILFVSPKMPFEFFIQCFQAEQPMFLVSQFEDGRIAITPNTMFLSFNAMQNWNAFSDLLPNEIEYVTMKNGTYPLILTAHPVANFDDWFKKFERFVAPFAKQTLSEFVGSSREFLPIEFEKGFKNTKVRTQTLEAAVR